ncbi:MAG: TlpA disulfide reductase family protein [Gammaproteobacteria bacterium]|nr:TlpA disulfide reductase family protein [Gammaproteobacteria bacterium]
MKCSSSSKRNFVKSGALLTALIFVIVVMISLSHADGLMDKISGSKASNFTLMSAHGSDISLSDYEGKFVLLNFWATWCPPCIKEMPALNDLHNKLNSSNGLKVVGVHVGPALATVKQFLKDNPVDFDIVIDKNMSLSNWEVSGLPTTFLISPSGKLIYKATGERDWNSGEMVDFLRGIMKEYERLATADADSDKG